MTARQELVDVVSAALGPAVRVIPYARDIELPDVETVMVRVDVIRPGASWGLRTYEAALVVCPVGQVGDEVEASLDALTEDVLGALESGEVPNAIIWTSAERATFDQRFPCYEVKTAATVAIERE